MIVDFHSHTSESDGTLSPQALADFMGERGVEVFSISDHDTLSAYGAFEAPAGTRVVTGVEINTTWRNNAVHILGYAFPKEDASLEALLARNREARYARAQRMVAQLRAAGYSISFQDVLHEAEGSRALGRPHVAKALVRLDIASDVDAAFRGFLRHGRPGYVPSIHVTPREAIDAIRASGGVAVLAHPGRLADRAIIDELARDGLDGLEVFYPRHDPEEVAFFRSQAERLGLLMTGGADFHDIRYHTRGVGMEVERDAILPFLERVEAA